MLGYDWNDGGINNQKLALLGLLFAASEAEDKTAYLPSIYSKDQHNVRSGVYPLAEIFELDKLMAFCGRWGINVVPTPLGITYADRIESGGWNFFGQGAGCVGNATKDLPSAYSSIAADFFRSLVPVAKALPLTHYLMGEIFGRLGIDTVVQLRIEEDWYTHSIHHLKQVVHEPEDYYITAPEIISKVKASFPEVTRVFVTCDERYIFAPKETITAEVEAKTGVSLVWKSDLIKPEEFGALPPVTTSLIDFEIAKTAERFVGMTRSTFANLVTFERFAAAYRDRGRDYVYNPPGSELRKRTDIGGQDNPAIACRPRSA